MQDNTSERNYTPHHQHSIIHRKCSRTSVPSFKLEAVEAGGNNGVGIKHLCNKVVLEGAGIIVITIHRCNSYRQRPIILTTRATPPQKLVTIITVGAMATMWTIGTTPEHVRKKFKDMCVQPQEATFAVDVLGRSTK